MAIRTPVFTEINESFACLNCGCVVPIASSTCRDHCPRCLWSLHVDVNPGDRAADCGGLLKPVSYYPHKKKGFMIEYACQRCGARRVNRFLERDRLQADAYDVLLNLQKDQC